MDSNDSKERNDYPRWPASKGPGFFSAFLQEMAGFMMRNKVDVFGVQIGHCNHNPQTLTCWRCGGAHRSVDCNVPCRCDICGKDDHATAHHNLYQRFKGKRSGDANVCTKPAIEQLTL